MSKGTVYLIHFEKKLHHAGHYIGWAKHLDERIKHHLNSTGARLLAVLNEKGLKWAVVRIWEEHDRHFEKKLKVQNNAARYCPTCTPGTGQGKGWSRGTTKDRLTGKRSRVLKGPASEEGSHNGKDGEEGKL